MNDTAITVEKVGKKFCPSLKRSMLYATCDIARNVVGITNDSSRLRRGEFWALDNISWDLKAGGTLGVIGPNGSGKTTLLRMLNGIFMPDKGRIEVRGKVGALIQVGAGFHPMLSGRENIYINGSILGMSKKEIDRKLESIMEFADIGDFMDAPVKTYSSGMYVRLGFAIAVHCEPRILLIDEILSVGDIKFQAKCYRLMIDKILNQGCAVVFVSHDRYSVQNLCKRTLYLNRGTMVALGDTREVINRYLEDLKSEGPKTPAMAEQFKDEDAGGIARVVFLNSQLEECRAFRPGERVIIRFYYHFKQKISNPSVAINFMHSDNRYSVVSSTDYLFHLDSGYDGVAAGDLDGDGYFEVTVNALYLPVGRYRCFCYLFAGHSMNLLEKNESAAEIEMLWAEESPQRSLIELPHQWAVHHGTK